MINTVTLILTLILMVGAMVLPRRYFLLPFILGACFIPADQRMIFLSLDFTPLRLLILAGFIRLIMRGEEFRLVWNRFDKLILAWILCGSVIYTLRWLNLSAAINRCGWMFDVYGLYILFRIYIQRWEDTERIVEMFSICSLCLTIFVAMEWSTGRNPCSVLGIVMPVIREGGYRCQASFPHSIMLGLFFATLFPLFAGYSLSGKRKWLHWLACGATVFIVIGTRSSTPVLTLLIVGGGCMCYRLRGYAGTAGWILLVMLTGMHLVMTKGVWHLLARVNVIGGSTGWHRFNLIDNAMKHISEWILLGTKSTGHWGYGLEDITNHFILEGVRGGGLTLALFIAVVVMAVRTTLYLSQNGLKEQQWLCWCLFVAMMGHITAFFGVSYFGQIHMLWYMNLAIVGMLYPLSQMTKAWKMKIPKKGRSMQAAGEGRAAVL